MALITEKLTEYQYTYIYKKKQSQLFIWFIFCTILPHVVSFDWDLYFWMTQEIS